MNQLQRTYQIFIFNLAGFLCLPVWSMNDPTRPYDFMEEPEIIEVEVPSNSEDWQLNGIQIRGDQRSAIINGRYVKEGETIGAAIVQNITPTHVVLVSNNQRLKIHLLELQVKQNPQQESNHAQPESLE